MAGVGIALLWFVALALMAVVGAQIIPQASDESFGEAFARIALGILLTPIAGVLSAVVLLRLQQAKDRRRIRKPFLLMVASPPAVYLVWMVAWLPLAFSIDASGPTAWFVVLGSLVLGLTLLSAASTLAIRRFRTVQYLQILWILLLSWWWNWRLGVMDVGSFPIAVLFSALPSGLLVGLYAVMPASVDPGPVTRPHLRAHVSYLGLASLFAVAFALVDAAVRVIIGSAMG